MRTICNVTLDCHRRKSQQCIELATPMPENILESIWFMVYLVLLRHIDSKNESLKVAHISCRLVWIHSKKKIKIKIVTVPAAHPPTHTHTHRRTIRARSFLIRR